MTHPSVRRWKPEGPNDREFLALSPLKKAAVWIGVLFSAGYYVWRAVATIHPESPIYSWFFWGCEVLGFASTLVFVYSTYRLRRRKAPPIKSQPTVDVMIATYNEDAEILSTAIYHCLNMEYPHKTYVLDDGRRPEIEKLARSMGAEYITRSDNQHAKAGNLNNALKSTRGDLIAVFDADGVPRKDFLTQMIGYFEDHQVAVAQAPQTFYNLDSFQHMNHSSEDHLWNEQSLFFDRIQSGRDACEAAMCCGTGSVFRRSALNEIGGMSTGTLIEDLHTTLNLHLAGYKSVYHSEPIAYCLAPSSLGPYVVQRARWALGAIQILKKTTHLIVGPSRLNLAQRISYLSTIYYVTAIQRATYYVAPLLYLMFGMSPIQGPDWFIIPFVLNLVFALSNYYILSRGRARLVMTEVFYLFMVWDYLKSVFLGLLPITFKFRVTSKTPNAKLPFSLLAPPVFVTLVSIAALSEGVRHLVEGQLDAGILLTINFSWIYMVIGILALIVAKKKPLFRDSYSFFDYRPLQIDKLEVPGIAVAVSEKSLRFIHVREFPANDQVTVKLDLPSESLTLDCEVTRCHSLIARGQAPLYQVDLDYVRLSAEDRTTLLRYFFEEAAPRVMSKLESEPSLRGSQKGPEQRQHARLPSLLPVFVGSQAGSEDKLGLLVDLSESGARLKFPGKLEMGASVSVQIPWMKSSVSGLVVRCIREQGHGNPPYDIGIRFSTAIVVNPLQRDSVAVIKSALPELYQAA